MNGERYVEDTRYTIEDFEIAYMTGENDVKKTQINNKNYTLTKFEMKFKENTHTIVNLELRIKNVPHEEWIAFYEHKKVVVISFRGRKIFKGVVEKYICENYYSDEYIIKLNLKSYSEILDRYKNYKVFQNSNLTYNDLVLLIEKTYKNIKILGTEDGNRLLTELLTPIYKGLVIQYDETDWEFLIRIVSHLQLAVFNTENGGITIGLSRETSVSKIWNEIQSNLSEVRENEETYYVGTNLSFYLCGERIFLKKDSIEEEKKLLGYVTEGVIILENSIFKGEYTIKKEDFIFPIQSNKKIKGCAIEGRVRRVPLKSKNNISYLTIDFTEGLEKIKSIREEKVRKKANRADYNYLIKIADKTSMMSEELSGRRRFYFPYATPYSKTKTGLFCTPEIGDRVIAFFPSDEESEGYILTAINNENSIRFSNPFERNYTVTEDEKELLIQLTQDMNETLNYVKDMSTINFEDKILYNFKIFNDARNLRVYVRDGISEETTTKGLLTTNILDIESKNKYSLKTKEAEATIVEKSIEKVKERISQIEKEEISGNLREEHVNEIKIMANSHKVEIK